MAEAGSIHRRLVSRLAKLVKAPVNIILHKMQERKQDAERKAIWKTSKAVAKPTYNRRLLDIATIGFDESYTIGISAVDTKHKVIMMAYNTLVNDATKFRRSRSRARILADRLKPLLMTFSEHFSEEEEIMFHENYPGLFRHVCQHDQFMHDIITLSDEIEGERADFEQLIFFIGAWLSGHILISDRYFGDFYERRMKAQAESTLQYEALPSADVVI